MKDQNTSQLLQQADQAVPQQVTASASSSTLSSSTSARHSRIRQATSESSMPINFARPIVLRPDSVDPDDHQHDRDISAVSTLTDPNSATAGDESEWHDEVPTSPYDRRAMNFSIQSDASGHSTPLKIRRRGMMNNKKLTIDVTSSSSSSRAASARRVASESMVSPSEVSPSSAAVALPPPAIRRASSRSNKLGKGKKNSPTESLAPPPSAGIRFAPFTPTKPSPLADHNRSPIASSGSPSSASAAPSSGDSDKPLLSVPRYGFNPEFQLGQSSSPRSAKSKTSPTKPSPTYSGVSQGGVKSMLYSNARIPATPLSPRAPSSSSSPRSKEAARSPRTPQSPRAPGTPRTPRTPLTARLPLTPSLGARSSAAYRGVLLTTVTRAGSNERIPTGMAGANAADRRTRNRSASIATEIRGFVRGGASEVIPRLELRVLERPRRESRLYGLDPNSTAPNKRHSLAAAQPSILKEKSDFAAQDVPDDSSPRAREFSRSVALDKLTSKRASASVGPRGSVARHSSNFAGLSFVGQDFYRRERRQTGASVVSGRSRRSDRSAKSNRSALSRRTSMPTSVTLKSSRPSLVSRRLSLAPSSFRGPRDEAMQPDSDESEDENDVVNELQSRVTNIQEAKRWILGHRPSQDGNAPNLGRDIHDDQRPMLAMRRPTYAASVFQQARLMEAERQAGAALVSSSVLNVNASGLNVNVPMTPFPQTPGYPKTPHTAFPDGEVEGEEPYPRPETAAAVLPELTWQQKTAHCLTAPLRFVKKQISPKYVLTMMDPREILFPITFRKIALWIVYGGVIAMLILLNRYYHWWAKLDHAVHGKNLAIMGVLYGFEPTMILIIMLVARVPDARVVPDRTVLVPRARNSTEVLSDDEDESRHSSSSSDDESVASADMATQMHSTILEEEDDGQDSAEHETQDQESGILDIHSKRNSKRLSGLRPPARRRSTHHTLASTRSGERRGSGPSSSAGGLQVPRTPTFDPRNRRSTIILHEPLSIDSLNNDLARLETRRPSAASHQLVLAQTASRDSRRSSYFGIFAAAAGARPGEATPDPAVAATADEMSGEKSDKDLVAVPSDSTGELDEKKAGNDKPDDVCIAMDSITHPSLTESTALIIPCHNADVEVLKAVLFAALVHFEPWQIFIIDNGNTPQPPNDMESSIRSQPMFARVNYIWLPVGNKNIAQFVGAKAAAVLNLDYVLTIDDDVIIPANFAAPMHIISETITAVCYPITAVDHKGDRPVFVGWQDIEYKLSALAKMAESKMCGVLFPHGAASFWNRETMIAVLRRHDLIYFADDVKMGLELQAIGERMGIDASISFETVAPETFLGPPTAGTPNYYNQRVRSWEMARHTLYWQFSKRFLFSLNGARTPVAIGWQKFTQFYNSTTNFIDWIRLPMFILLGGSGQFWLKSFAFIIFLPIVPILLYRFVKTRNRPDLHPHLIDMLTYGIYKLMYSVVCVLGGIRSMLVFFPNHGHKPTLAEMEKSKDPRCIWLRDDFMKNSGGQGDLRDEPQQILLDDAAAAAEEQEAVTEEAQAVAVLPSVTVTPQGEEQPTVAVLNVPRRPSKVTPIDEQLPTLFEPR